MPSNLTGIILSILSAIFWGSGDFSGGYATRRFDRYAVLAISSISGILVLVICLFIWPERPMQMDEALFAVLAGICGVFGLGSLYMALSMGHAAIVAPTAAVIGAALPMIFGTIMEGFSSNTRFAGFLIAFLGIWMVSYVSGEKAKKISTHLILSIIAGISFGGFFIFISLASSDHTFIPLVISRTTFCVVTLSIALLHKQKMKNELASPIIWLTGILDAGGNALFLLAKQYTRLDVAVVLSSLYPAMTVILSKLVLKEKISRNQWIGVGICILAVILISV